MKVHGQNRRREIRGISGYLDPRGEEVTLTVESRWPDDRPIVSRRKMLISRGDGGANRHAFRFPSELSDRRPRSRADQAWNPLPATNFLETWAAVK